MTSCRRSQRYGALFDRSCPPSRTQGHYASGNSLHLSSQRFRLIKSISLKRYLPRHFWNEKILLLSDLHLYPKDSFWVVDSPSSVVEVVETFAPPKVYLLGDIFEGLPMTRQVMSECLGAPRLNSFFGCMSSVEDVVYLPGNHDFAVAHFLEERGIDWTICHGGFKLGNVEFFHGHEIDQIYKTTSLLASQYFMRRIAVPAGSVASRFGFRFNSQMTNRKIAHKLRAPRHYIIFGHTHVAELHVNFCNLGMHLRKGRRTFGWLEEGTLSLIECI